MLLGLIKEIRQRLGGACEGFRELLLLLVAPSLLKRLHLGMQRRNQALQIGVESRQIGRESTQLGRVYIGFGHERSLNRPLIRRISRPGWRMSNGIIGPAS